MALTIRADSRDYQGMDNTAIQRAVDDAASSGGGTVEIPAGTYLMQDSLHLRSGVRIIGEKGTVLLKVPSISSPIDDYLGYGHYEFTVTEPDTFRVGMGVHIADRNSFGFYETVATIIGERDGLFFIDRMLNHDYDPDQGGEVTSIFPIVSGVGITGASIENITIDGNSQETRVLNGCRGGGVYLLQSRDVRIEAIEVIRYRGDAVSFQQCADLIIWQCILHNNTGGGLHPGSGSVRYVMEENHISGNGGCGIFYCLRTTHSICKSNRIENNGEAGISIGERDTDHLIVGNTITGNGLEGIYFRGIRRHGGDRVLVLGNTIAHNCRKNAQHEIKIESGLRDIYILENTIEPEGGSALYAGSGCQRISFSGNTVSGRAQTPNDISGEPDLVMFITPDVLPEVGPDALPADGTRHLGIEELPPWESTD